MSEVQEPTAANIASLIARVGAAVAADDDAVHRVVELLQEAAPP